MLAQKNNDPQWVKELVGIERISYGTRSERVTLLSNNDIAQYYMWLDAKNEWVFYLMGVEWAICCI